MRNVFRKGYREFEFMNSRETRFVEFKDRFQAMEFLREFFFDPLYMNKLRQLLDRETYGINLSAVSDYGVLEQIADLLVSRRIRLVERYDLFEAGFHTYAGIEEAETAAEPEPEYIDEPETEDEPEAPVDLWPGAATQAAVLVQAAVSGSPFCEA
jgi:hypothetical protein